MSSSGGIRCVERDVNITPFSEIMEELDATCEGFVAAVFYDREGETIDYHSYLDPFDTRLTAAHLGVVMTLLETHMAKTAMGRIIFLEVFAKKQDSLTLSMGDDLFLSVVFKAGCLDSGVNTRLLHIAQRIRDEI